VIPVIIDGTIFVVVDGEVVDTLTKDAVAAFAKRPIAGWATEMGRAKLRARFRGYMMLGGYMMLEVP